MEGSNKSVIGAKWYTTLRGSVGFVACELNNGTWRGYVGPAAGRTEKEDSEYIAQWGGKLEEHIARAVFPHLCERKYYDENKYQTS